MRRVVDLIRGTHVHEAQRRLHFSPLGAHARIAKVLKSAVANAEQQPGIIEENLVVKRGWVDEGPTLKRFRPRAYGRATQIRKRTSPHHARRRDRSERSPAVGHKVNPYGFRLGVIYPWKSNWYAGRDYATYLHQDVRIRKHIRGRLSRAGISSIDIERKGDQVWVFIRTARPGIVIGRKGAEVERIRKDLERITGKRVDVKVEDMNQTASDTRPETDATLLAQGVAEQLAGRVVVPPGHAPRGPDRHARRRPGRPGAVRRPPGRRRDVAAASGTARAASRCTRSGPRSTTARPRPRRRSGSSA